MIEAKVEEINEFKGINALKFSAKFGKLTMVSLEIPANLSINSRVKLGFKSSEVILSLEKLQNCSLSNEIGCIIQNITIGEILSVVNLKALNSDDIFDIIITTASAKRLN
ncbi:MAG: hypothetical protein J6W17_01450, partial [Campylobacter sp.]|nr:hypothetical protein [Campylobacter sp.]